MITMSHQGNTCRTNMLNSKKEPQRRKDAKIKEHAFLRLRDYAGEIFAV
jgi:hypothetical protein